MSEQGSRPPRDNIIRAVLPGVELRSEGDTGMPTLFGHFAVFNRWTEIDSFFEGHFLERIAPGAFKKTFRETTPKVLFQHGMDPSVGDKPLGPPETLREDGTGAFYEVPMLDTSYNRDIVPGLEAGLYGASFRFSVIREEFVKEPKASEENPSALPERTIKEARVPEFGPVTFPAYEDASAGVRSLTDEFLFKSLTRDPERLRMLVEFGRSTLLEQGEHPAEGPDNAPPREGAEAKPHSDHGSRDKQTLYGTSRKEKPSWLL